MHPLETAQRMPKRWLLGAGALLLVAILLVVVWACNTSTSTSSGGTPSGTPSPTIASLSSTTASPASLLTINGSNLGQSAHVKFFDGTGYSLTVSPVSTSSSALVVSVPPYFALSAGMFQAGTVSVQVLVGTTSVSNVIGGFQIQDLPQLPSTAVAGIIALAFLQGAIQAGPVLQTGVSGTTSLNEPSARIGLSKITVTTGQLSGTIGAVVAGTASSADLGTINGQDTVVGPSDLANADRLLLTLLVALANQQPQPPPTLSLSQRLLSFGVEPAWAQAPSGCLQNESAKSITDLLNGSSQPTLAGDLNAVMGDANGVPACAGQASVQAFEYLGAWVAAMGAFTAWAEIEAGAALARAGAVLTYGETLAAYGLIQAGATNGQNSAANRQTVESGASLLNSAITDVLSNIADQVAGGPISTVISGFQDLGNWIKNLASNTPPVSACSGSTPNQCGNQCTDLTTDPQNCGSCSNACGGGQLGCSQGQCSVCNDSDAGNPDIDDPDCD
jgi:hypothetical protein